MSRETRNRERPVSAGNDLDARAEVSQNGATTHRPDYRPAGARASGSRDRVTIPRPRERQEVPLRELASLIAADTPQPVAHGDRAYLLSGREIRALGTIGTFRAVPLQDILERDLLTDTEVTALQHRGIIETHNIALRGETRAVVVISHSTRQLLEAHQTDDPTREPQRLHSGLVKPAELAHDAELYALYEIAAADLTRGGASIDRVRLDYDLKGEYQSYLHRPDRDRDRDATTALTEDREAWAADHGLTIVDGELYFPDLRIEYRDADGEPATRDIELVTPHYASSAVSAKRRAGFALYRCATRPARAKGSVPHPRLFERLV